MSDCTFDMFLKRYYAGYGRFPLINNHLHSGEAGEVRLQLKRIDIKVRTLYLGWAPLVYCKVPQEFRCAATLMPGI